MTDLIPDEFPPAEAAKRQVEAMLALRNAGMTILYIAKRYEIGARTIYNLIKRHTDIDMALMRKQKAEASKKQRHEQFHSREVHGFKWAEYRRLVKIGATQQFSKQRDRARDRGVEWKFTFEQWWRVWDESGHYEQRGKGADKYVMARFNDVGPYSAENVEIVTGSKNGKDLGTRRAKEGVIVWAHLHKKKEESHV